MKVSPRKSKQTAEIISETKNANRVGSEPTKYSATMIRREMAIDAKMNARVYLYSLRTVTLILRVLKARNSPIA